ncbi:DUF7344 domain-containing protein [Haladaptatus cibarius]|uniref:DUF7344 domain-containing protein n=1 Tax=Haladaptatus cibarius TaxID=453847 RepID=UPI0006796B15|nr:hypothetical protein [Haladaptatus cibarius]
MSATERATERISNPVTESEPSVERKLSTDDVFHLLQSQRRRDAIRFLRDKDGPVEMRDIAEQVAAWENDTTVQTLSSSERQRAYIPLYQSHLPKLDEEGIIEYDQNRGIVRKTPLSEQLECYLDVDDEPTEDEDSRQWNAYYLGVSGAGTLLFLGAILNAPLFSLLPATVTVAVVLAAFWMVSISHSISV